ncbi:elongation factor G [uncultured Subdoligranulum sp.]|uniref:elongation factor G n=1 Tax=uncultured Subdoligranulum sp. TaxID=512298 RepID=UPI0025F3ADC8|nr:elongation factor G [uncultured Subdoligranulum sp.]
MEYASKDIRNILVAGHAGCGKTTLVEALLYLSGATERMGRVEDGTTASDFDPEEAKRKASLNSSVVPVEIGGTKYNLVDVPGLFDFEAAGAEGLAAVESVMICVSGRSGVSVGAEKAYRQAVRQNKARLVFVTKTDLENADYFKILEQMKIRFGPSVCPCVVPARLDDGTVAYINLFSQKAFKYESGKQVQIELPDIGHRFEGLIQAMNEAIAETDETLMEKFFEGEPFTTEEIVAGMAAGVRTGQITPVFCGSAVNLQALDMLLYNLKELLPAPDAAPAVAETADGEPVEIAADPAAPTCAYVFKTVADPFVGKLSFIKVLAGRLTAASNVVNARTGQPERLGKTLTVCGKRQTDTPAIPAGDIGAVAKLPTAKTGDTLCDPARVVSLPAPVYPAACYRMAVKVAKKGDEGKVSGALARLMEEDPSITFTVDPETKQQVIAGLGTQHLEVAVAKLKNKFGVEITLEAPRVPYRESIRKSCKAQGRHKKQTGGHGQFGDVWIQFEPCEGDEIQFEEKVFGGSVPKNFFPAVEKGVRQAAAHGVLAGYPMVGMKATLLDGSYHPVDSSEMAFIMAAKLAYKAAIPEAGPVLLEPIGTLQAHVPADNTGDIMGEVTKRRGRVLGMSPDPEEEGGQVVEAEVPMAEMQDFTTYLRQLTQGRGHFTFRFVRYETLPQMLEAKVIEQAKALGNLSEEDA